MTHVTHVGLQLSHTLVFWCVQDHREFGKIILCLNWIVDL